MKLKGLGVYLLTFMLVVNSLCIPAATGTAEEGVATSTDLGQVQSTEVPEPTEVPVNTETAEPSETPDGTELPAETVTPVGTENPEETENPEATETPEATENPEGTDTPEGTELPENTEALEPTMTPEPTVTPEPTETPVPLALQSLMVEKNVYAPGDVVIWNVACEGAESITYEIRNRQGDVVQSGEPDENARILFQTEVSNTYTITVTAAAGEESQSQASTVFVTNNDLTVTLTTDMLYAVANESALACQAAVQGGVAPYTAAVQIAVDGSIVYEESMTDQEAGCISIAYMPTVFGVHAVSVVVTDAAGMTMEAAVELPVAIREPETAEDWKNSVNGAALTGDWRKDLVAVAKTQVGYQESVRDFIMDEAGKTHGYTRYGAWHGSAYDEWSTLFVSFCVNYANIPTAYFPQSADCSGLASMLRNKGLYMADKDSYEPKAGDLIFFSLGGGSVGIVESVSDETVHVIMVNTEKTVGRTNYSKRNSSIVGYGSMEAAMRNAGLLKEENPEGTDAPESTEPTVTPEPTETPVPLALQSLMVEKNVYAPGDVVIWNVACEGAESITYEIRNRQGDVVQSGEPDENARILFQTEVSNTYTITVTAAAGEESQSQASTVFVTNNDLTVTLTTDMLYAVANESALACQAAVQGGVAPYTAAVQIAVDGSIVYEESMTDQEAGCISVAYMPTVFGVHAVSVVVTDAAGMTMEAATELPVAIREPETAEDWKNSVNGAALTGDWRKDLVAVAKTQAGYQESVRDFIMDEAGKTHGYTRYGAWHGSAYDEWSTLFVSFCVNYANIPTAYFPQSADCGGLASMLSEKGLYMADKDSYEPQSGDLIFFNLEGGSTPEHVGIVESVSDGTVRVIMANTEKTVGRTAYSAHDESIVGYGSMEAAMRNAGLLEEAKNPEIILEARWEGETLGVGDVVTLTALDTEGAAIVWQWMDETGEWKLAQEGGESLAFEVTEENFSWSWRAVYVSDLEKAEGAQNTESAGNAENAEDDVQ